MDGNECEFISPYGERAKEEITCVDNFDFKYCDFTTDFSACLQGLLLLDFSASGMCFVLVHLFQLLTAQKACQEYNNK
jgi:hypothetical protein